MSILQTTDLKKYYGAEPNITRALDGVTFSVEEGEFVAVVGTSGSGKSTLLHMMGGLDTPTSGSVVVRDKELAKMNDEQLTIFRRRNIGFVFQNYNLVPILNVYENIVLPVELDGDTVDKKFMDEVVKMLGLQDKLQNMPNNLSGGQQQRVAIARALVSKPAIVLADEPTGNLDSKTSADGPDCNTLWVRMITTTPAGFFLCPMGTRIPFMPDGCRCRLWRESIPKPWMKRQSVPLTWKNSFQAAVWATRSPFHSREKSIRLPSAPSCPRRIPAWRRTA